MALESINTVKSMDKKILHNLYESEMSEAEQNDCLSKGVESSSPPAGDCGTNVYGSPTFKTQNSDEHKVIPSL